MGGSRGVFIFICLFNTVFSQVDLVPNSSFESFSSCPIGGGPIEKAIPWFNPTINTPDYFHICDTSPSGGVPCNWTGCQNARTGVGYSGIGSQYASTNSREYIEVQFINPLKAGKNYCIEFYVSRAGKYQLAIDRLGAYISIDSIYSGNLFYLPYQPQIENPQGNIVSDTTNWVLISGQYLAGGGEKFITIGNFYPDSLTQVDTMPGGFSPTYSYYYIDDVRVYCCGADSCMDVEEEFFIPNAFSPNGDWNNDFWQLPGAKPESMELAVYDRWGNEVFRTDDPGFKWDGTYRGKALDAGIYVYYLKGVLWNEEIFEKGNLTIVR